jgi:hypothetical protein
MYLNAMRKPFVKPAALLFALGLALGCSTSALAQAPGPGEVQLKLPGGGIYIGTVTNGVPDGKGYFKDADGMQYEGEVHMGQRTGVADGLFSDGNRYQGEWKDGKPDGIGKMTYMLGGAYEGEWKDGRRHGKGMMTFAGSGRRAEVRFANGRRVDVAPELPSPATASAKYSLSSGNAPVGSHIPDKVAHSPLPLDRGFDELTPDQQRFVRSYYPALDAGDDPPYPLKGGQELYAVLAKLAGRYSLHDDVLVYVAVDADARVSSVTTVGALDPEIKRMIGTAAGLLKYTPARCGGKPCRGVVPFNLKLSVQN